MALGLHTPRTRAITRLNAVSEVVETECGPVEFARRGNPPYVLIMHGTPQGHHASFIGEPFEEVGFGTITPSRPGYIRTPLTTGRTPAEQADAAAALLDALGIEQVAVYGISGGGPSSIEFAARHPERAQALILEVAISHAFQPDVSERVIKLSVHPLVLWIAKRTLQWLPRIGVGQFVKTESTLDDAERARVTNDILATPSKLALLRRLINSQPPPDLLLDGFDNDLRQFREIERLPLSEVRCPTLVVHGTHDRDVPFSHAEHSANEIPGAELFRVEKGWHLLALSDNADAYIQAEIDFLHRHLGP